MKKFWVLFSFFVLPLVFYIFLSKGIYKYSNLPILNEKIGNINIPNGKLEEHLSVVCFLGNNINTAKGTLFNLNQTIYKRYYQKPYFQAIAIIPKDQKDNYVAAINELAAYTDIVNWKFVYASNIEIQEFFNSLQTSYSLNNDLYSNYAFIIDKEKRLRGRKDDEDTAGGKLFGYNTQSIAVLKNKMKDDIDIIYYQLKKSAEKEQRRKRKI